MTPAPPWVWALKALQNSMMLMLAPPSAGPTGGAGDAEPAGIWSLMTCSTFFAIWPLLRGRTRVAGAGGRLDPRARGAAGASGTGTLAAGALERGRGRCREGRPAAGSHAASEWSRPARSDPCDPENPFGKRGRAPARGLRM